MELWQLYLLIVLPNVGGLMVGVGVISGFCTCICAFLTVTPEVTPETLAFAQKWVKRFFFSVIVAAFVAAIIPSERGMYTLIGGYYVTNIDGISDLPPNVVGAMNSFLENYVKSQKKE